jgi:hypothetical protein
LLLDGQENESIRTDLEAICSAVERSAALTLRLVAFSRRHVLRVEPIDLAREIGEGRTRVLFVSGYSQRAIPDVVAVAVGGMLEKPFTVNELLRAVEQALI